MRRYVFLLLLTLPFLPSPSRADLIVGGETTYATRKGDCLLLVSARVGLDWQIIARENGLSPKNQCKVGAGLSLDNRKIVPEVIEKGIIINITDRMLYFFREGKLLSFFPVGLGSRDFPTPTGSFVIVGKERNPTWYVPKSIQKEMEQKGQVVKAVVPPGPENPLGRLALHTSLPGILIHETIWPTTVYQWRSHGCIRVLPENMEAGFFDEVDRGMPGEIIYKPVNVAVSEEGAIFLQVDRDIYRKITSMEEEVRAEIKRRGLSDRVDWVKVARLIRRQSGMAEDITR